MENKFKKAFYILLKEIFIFLFCGGIYYIMEIIFKGTERGSHWSMFCLAGVAGIFFIDGFNNFFSYDMDYLLQILLCTVCITACEYYIGITLNKDFIIWDYRNMPWNLNGQICPTFSLVWAGLSAISIPILDWIEWKIFKYKPETPPYYKVFGHKIFQMGRKKNEMVN